MRRRAYALSLALAGLLWTGVGQAAGVLVEVAPAKIERRIFEPERPPPEMPKLTPPEAAVCAFEFGCNVESRVQGKRTLLKSSPAELVELKFTPQLRITIWIPRNGTMKLVDHEEAHRKICEYYYASAEAVARAVGQKAIGAKLRSNLKNEAETQKELREFQQRLIDEVLRQIGDHCLYAQGKFDELTAHGTNALEEDKAIDQSIAAEKAAPDESIPRRMSQAAADPR